MHRLGLLCLLLSAGAVRAEESVADVLLPVPPSISSLYYDLGPVYATMGVGFPEGPLTLTGARFLERNSGLGKMLMYIVTQAILSLGEGAAAAGGKYAGSSYHVGYRIDYYRPYTSGELASMRAAREQAGDALVKSNMSLDLQLYLPVPGLTTSSGISAELTPLTVELGRHGNFGVELGVQYAKLTDVVQGGALPDGTPQLRSYEYLGTPLRFMLAFRFVQAQLQWAPNFLGGFGISPREVEKRYLESVEKGGNRLYTNSPWSLSVSLHPLKWLWVRATGLWTKYEFNVNALGYQLEAGLRF